MGEYTPDHFIKAMEGIHNYVGMNYKKYTTESTTALEGFELNNSVEPTAPDPALEHWKVQHGAMMRRFRNMLASGPGCVAW